MSDSTSMIHAYLASKGLQPTSENVSRALQMNAQNPGVISGLVNQAPPQQDAQQPSLVERAVQASTPAAPPQAAPAIPAPPVPPTDAPPAPQAPPPAAPMQPPAPQGPGMLEQLASLLAPSAQAAPQPPVQPAMPNVQPLPAAMQQLDPSWLRLMAAQTDTPGGSYTIPQPQPANVPQPEPARKPKPEKATVPKPGGDDKK